jgi:hypothetical protein
MLSIPWLTYGADYTNSKLKRTSLEKSPAFGRVFSGRVITARSHQIDSALGNLWLAHLLYMRFSNKYLNSPLVTAQLNTGQLCPMSYELSIIQEPEYLHVIVTGVNNRENVERYLEEIVHECTIRGCRRVLIEEQLEGPRLGTIDVFEAASEGSRHTPGNIEAFAYVDVNAEGNLMNFAETVAVNRGVLVRVFASVRDAKKWLLDNKREGAEQ